MELIEFKEKLMECSEKICSLLTITSDINQLADMHIMDDGSIYLNNVKTPYNTENVLYVKYRVFEYDDEANYIRVFLDNEDYFDIDIYCDYSGCLNGKDYNSISEFKKYVTSCETDTKAFNTWQDVMDQFKYCLDKIGGIYNLQSDEDEIADLCFIGDKFYLWEEKTPYSLNDFESIKYWIGYNNEELGICISFKNGDVLDLDNYLDCSAHIDSYHQYFRDTVTTMNYYSKVCKAEKLGVIDDIFVIVDGTLIRYNGEDKKVIIPDGVKVLYDEAFVQQDIEEVVCPISLEKIGWGAFSYCHNLKKVTLNDGLKIIESCAFNHCDSLETVNKPSSLESVSKYSFCSENLLKQFEEFISE